MKISGTGGSSVSVSYKPLLPDCDQVRAEWNDLIVKTRFQRTGRNQTADVDLEIRVPSRFDVALDSMGGGLEIDGVKGAFTGETKGGEISVTDSTLNGSVHTMGGRVTIENVLGDLKGSSMGGDVRYKNVRRADGKISSPPHTGD